LVIFTLCVVGSFAAVLKASDPADGNSPVSVPSPVSGTLIVGWLAESVATASAPVAPPGCSGAIVTGTRKVLPAVSVTGNVTGALTPLVIAVAEPVPKGSGDAALAVLTPVTVTPVVAVSATVAVADLPTATCPKLICAVPVSGALLDLPKPSTCPSRVPT
jgi:hypothetical protein